MRKALIVLVGVLALSTAALAQGRGQGAQGNPQSPNPPPPFANQPPPPECLSPSVATPPGPPGETANAFGRCVSANAVAGNVPPPISP